MTLKWPQNGAKSGPKMVQGGRRTPKKNLKINSPILGRPRAPKSTPKLTQKSKKTDLGTFLFNPKKHDFPGAVFSCFLKPPGGPRPSKSSQNAVRVCKNEGGTFSWKNRFFYKKCPKMTSLGTPKTHRKLKKTEKGASRNGAEKNTQNKHAKWTCLSNGTGSAFKRRARSEWIPERFLHFKWSSAAPPRKFSKKTTSSQDSETSPKKRQNTSKVSPKWP